MAKVEVLKAEDMLSLRNVTVHLTGHRPNRLGGFAPNTPENVWIVNNTRRLLRALRELGYYRLISGMAIGYDQWGLEVGIELGFECVAAIPCAKQESVWPQRSQAEYRRLLERCAHIFFVSTKPYAPELMLERNNWMVERAAATLSVFNGQQNGGTFHCLKKAKAFGNLIIYMNSKERNTTIFSGPVVLPET